jgi:murein DD-endopeptidase MepM/ murein hydrolase activator NlpD
MARNKYISGLLIAGFAVILLITVRREGADRGPRELETLEAAGSPLEPSPPEPAFAGTIARNTSFYDLMTGCGVAPQEIRTIADISKSVYDFRRVYPGQSYEFYADSSGSLEAFKLMIDDESYVEVTKGDGDFTAERKNYQYEVSFKSASGLIEQSLYTTILGQGLPVELGVMLSDIFAWDIDFFTDVRKNDYFRVIYEEKRRPAEDGAGEIVKIGAVVAAEFNTRGVSHYAFLFDNGAVGRDYFDGEGKSLRKQLLRAPLTYTRISSSFSKRRLHPILHHYAPHYGIDYAAPAGTPVMSTGDGTVMAACFHHANGNYVKIRHNSTYITYYLHFSRFARGIKAGARVKQGQVIGYVGSTGYATGPHVDYRIMKNGRFVNPRTIKLPPANPVSQNDMARFMGVRDSLSAELRRVPIEDGRTEYFADGAASAPANDAQGHEERATRGSAAH